MSFLKKKFKSEKERDENKDEEAEEKKNSRRTTKSFRRRLQTSELRADTLTVAYSEVERI